MASIGVQFVAEMLCMMTAIWLGEAVLAAELLAKSKSLHMGITGVSIGFGIAFFVAISSFSCVSATINPGMLFAKWICGKVTTEQWLVLTVADFVGAFLGAFLVWLTYLGHFSLIPEVPNDDEVKQIKLAPTTVREAYISNPKGEVRERINDGKDKLRFGNTESILRQRATLQVAALQHAHEREATPSDVDLHEQRVQTLLNSINQSYNVAQPRVPHIHHPPQRITIAEQLFHSRQLGASVPNSLDTSRSAYQTPDGSRVEVGTHESQTNVARTLNSQMDLQSTRSKDNINDGSDSLDDMPENLVIYEKLVIQDQNAKLSVFATRPAIFHWQTNLLSEILATLALILFALLIEENGYLLPNADDQTIFARTSVPVQIGTLITGLVLCFAGPTGFAANAARDCGPRFFHWVAPIPNKGPSEWHYAWVAVLGPYIGSTIGGFCFVAIRQMYPYPEWSYPIVSQQTMFGGYTDIF